MTDDPISLQKERLLRASSQVHQILAFYSPAERAEIRRRALEMLAREERTQVEQTRDQLEQNAEIEGHIIASIEKTSWTEEPLTESEKQLIGMAVSAVLYGIRAGTIAVR